MKYDKYDVDMLDKSSTSITGKKSFIQSLQISEVVGEFPSFTLKIFTPDYSEYTDYKELKLKLTTSTEKFELTVCIVSQEWAQDYLILRGFFCSFDNYSSVKTLYLGANIKEAVSNLNFEQTIVLDKNVQFEAFRVNSTAIAKLLELCNIESSTPYWGIRVSEINLKEDNKINEMVYLDNVSIFNYVNNSSYSIEESSYGDIYYCSRFGSYSYLGNNYNYQALKNLITNSYYKEVKKPNSVLCGKISSNFPYYIGSKLKNEISSYKNITQWTVISLRRTFENGMITSEVQYIGNNDPKE